MTSVALASVHGAPGVTTTALLLAARLGAPLVEADLSGGVIAVRYGLGREPGLSTLAAAAAGDRGRWLEHAQDAGGVATLVGPDSPDVAESLWRIAGRRIIDELALVDRAAVVYDAGRLARRSPAVDAAELVLVIAEPIPEQAVGLSHALASLAGRAPDQVAIVLVGPGPYRPGDIERDLGCEVIAHLPDDPTTAAHLRDGGSSPGRVARSRLARAVAEFGGRIEAGWDRAVTAGAQR